MSHALRRVQAPLMRSVSRDIATEIESEEQWEKLAAGDKPVVVDFHADWCGPCHILGPKLEKMHEKVQEKVELCKVDVDEHQELAQQFQIQSIPAVFLLHRGAIQNSFVGVISDAELEYFFSGAATMADSKE